MATVPQKPKPVMSDRAVKVAQWTLSLAGLAILGFVAALIVFSPNTEASSTTREYVQELVESTVVGPAGAAPGGTVATTTATGTTTDMTATTTAATTTAATTTASTPVVTSSSSGSTRGIVASEPTKKTEVDAAAARSDALIGGLAALGGALLVFGLALPGIQSFKTASFEVVMRGAAEVTPEEKGKMADAVIGLADESGLTRAQTAQLALAAEERLRLEKLMAGYVFRQVGDDPASWAAIRDLPPPKLDQAAIDELVKRSAFDIGVVEHPP